MPKSDSAELTLLAIDAARGKIPQFNSGVFGKDLDWNTWKKQPDLRQLQVLFENNSLVRNAFARAVHAYPGRRHVVEIANASLVQWRSGAATRSAIQTVFERYLMNWASFEKGIQDEQFRAALIEQYEFRDEVARAIGFRGEEALTLGALAIDMWKAAPIGVSRKQTRSELLAALVGFSGAGRIREILAGTVRQEENWTGWTGVESDLVKLIAQDPSAACGLWEAMKWPRPFALVLREELLEIEASRELKRLAGESAERQVATTALDASDLAAHKKLFGVAFSGGGIRSATFNLGVLQKLTNIGLLGKVDYLSTVSGGGYIGSWLAAWTDKNGGLPFPDFLDKLKNLLSPACPDPRAAAQKPIGFLREFSNYLTPRLGSFGFDTWTMGAVYTRNVILNQLVLIAFLGTLLLIPRLLSFALLAQFEGAWMGLLSAALLFVGVLFMSINMRKAVSESIGPRGGVARYLSSRVPPALYEPKWIQLLVILPILLSVYFASVWFWANITELDENRVLVYATLFSAFLSLLLSGIGGFVYQFRYRRSGSDLWWLKLFFILLLITAMSAGSAALLLHFYVTTLRWIHDSCSGIWTAEIWSPVVLLAVLVIPGTLQVGLMGVDYPDAGREWLSRFRAVCSVYSTYWIFLMLAGVYGPLFTLTVAGWTVKGFRAWLPTLTIGWISTTIAGLLAGSSSRTGRDKDGNPTFSWLQVLAKVGPPAFIVGLVLWIATLEDLLLAHGWIPSYSLSSLTDQCRHWALLIPYPFWQGSGWYVDSTGRLFAVLFILCVVLAWRVDINEFSMHHFYKNRLVRCYLGASNENRRPNPFTGFDTRDDLNLSQLKATPSPNRAAYLGPYPILNATLNLSAGKQLAWQERKGASFIFSPCYSGFDLHGWAASTGGADDQIKTKKARFWSKDTLRPMGYRKTSEYSTPGGPLLGTAMSISGAAANPNQGYNTSPTVSFLMTMFDVRLGWWLGNPRRDVCSELSSPEFGLAALLSELAGTTDDETRFVSLSDGGHFDNMGLYELVRRRCSFILLCDAEQDSEYDFGGLGAAIRKCRIDFGALIEIDPIRIKPGESGKPSESHCTVGKISYLDGSEGILVYIKASLTGDEPEDVTQYRAKQGQFPHETTADQWFAESQFESYRALGYHATHFSLEPAKAWVQWDNDRPNVAEFFSALKSYWWPVNPSLKESASRHTGTLSELFERIRQNSALQQLGAELFPGGFTAQVGPRPVTEEFYFSMSVIQLMEDLYFDFQLDHKKWFNDPRIGGWRYLFQRWKNVPAVASAWAAERDTFRNDFQVFWASL
ncbi:MAG TPA: patatin-like phospholipase family protein [Terracidiphilus sp.]